MLRFREAYKANPQRGFATTGEFSHWGELLEKWCEVHERYCRMVPDDPIFWYTERPNIGALAAAAWLCKDWCALEEFELDKIAKRSSKYGRGDLYLKFRDCEAYVEAKFVWCREGSVPRIEKVVDAMEKARNDARNLDLDGEESVPRVGVVFATPSNCESERRAMPKALSKFVEAIDEEIGPDAAAWCFPPGAEDRSDEGREYPGVFLLAKRARID